MNINPVIYISNLWSIVHKRLSEREDSEHEQAILRIALLSLAVLYLIAIKPIEGIGSENTSAFLSFVAPIYYAISLLSR